MRRVAQNAALLAAIGLLGACSDPYTAPPTATATVAATLPAGELPGRVPESTRSALARPETRPTRDAKSALRAYAELTTNWTASNAAERFDKAARAAVGQARRDAQQTAASVQNDPQFAGTASRATTVAIVDQAGGWALVITREQLAPDAEPARYRVYRAHTRTVAGGIAVDAWESQP